MIAALTGQLVSKAPSQIILDVNGVGYEIFIPLSTYFSLPNLKEPLSLNIHTQLRDNALQLFGFLSPTEKDAFVMLTGISGIGGKLALSALSTLAIGDLISAVQTNDLDKLSSVPGVGKKSAGRIVLELKDKITKLRAVPDQDHPDVPPHYPSNLEEDAVSALVNLGYRAADVKEAVKRVRAQRSSLVELADLIRETLKELATASS